MSSIIDINDYEIFRQISYKPFENNGKLYNLSNYPYLSIVMSDFCNARCNFCIGNLIHKKLKCNIDVYKEKIKFAIQKMGVKEVLLVGGEPTINDDIFEIIKILKQFNLNKICVTTNGIRLTTDKEFADRLYSSGISNINLSLMTFNEEKQREINHSKINVNRRSLIDIYNSCNENNIKLRINNNVFKNNNDNFDDLITFYVKTKNYCHSVKFSPLLKTDSFSVVNNVTEWVRNNILTDDEYDNLWSEVEQYYNDLTVIKNNSTLGFVGYSFIPLKVPIILNYNQHGKLMQKVVQNKEINNIKLLPTGDLSLSWNREMPDYFIKTEE